MLELTNLDLRAKSKIEFESRDDSLLVSPWTEIMTSYFLFQNTFILRISTGAIFADINKIVTMLIKTIRNNVSKSKICLYFLI